LWRESRAIVSSPKSVSMQGVDIYPSSSSGARRNALKLIRQHSNVDGARHKHSRVSFVIQIAKEQSCAAHRARILG
jgi:hypothetical protein